MTSLATGRSAAAPESEAALNRCFVSKPCSRLLSQAHPRRPKSPWGAQTFHAPRCGPAWYARSRFGPVPCPALSSAPMWSWSSRWVLTGDPRTSGVVCTFSFRRGAGLAVWFDSNFNWAPSWSSNLSRRLLTLAFRPLSSERSKDPARQTELDPAATTRSYRNRITDSSCGRRGQDITAACAPSRLRGFAALSPSRPMPRNANACAETRDRNASPPARRPACRHGRSTYSRPHRSRPGCGPC